jgi:hypothetical protein
MGSRHYRDRRLSIVFGRFRYPWWLNSNSDEDNQELLSDVNQINMLKAILT